MIEIKDGYAGFLKDDWGREILAGLFLRQAMDQVQAAGARPLRWYFSQKDVADYAERLFERDDLKSIEVKFELWLGREK
jgi:hypothetical protein